MVEPHRGTQPGVAPLSANPGPRATLPHALRPDALTRTVPHLNSQWGTAVCPVVVVPRAGAMELTEGRSHASPIRER